MEEDRELEKEFTEKVRVESNEAAKAFESLEQQHSEQLENLEAESKKTLEQKIRQMEGKIRKRFETEFQSRLESELEKATRTLNSEADQVRVELEVAKKETDKVKKELRKTREMQATKNETVEEIRRESLRLRTEIANAEKKLAHQEAKAQSDMGTVVARHRAEVLGTCIIFFAE